MLEIIDPRLVVVAFCFIVVDYISGMLKGAATKTLSSQVMRAGLFHKMSLFLLMLLGVMIDYAQTLVSLGFSIPAAASVCVYVILMEITSIVENLCAAYPDLMPDKILALFGENTALQQLTDKEESDK